MIMIILNFELLWKQDRIDFGLLPFVAKCKDFAYYKGRDLLEYYEIKLMV